MKKPAVGASVLDDEQIVGVDRVVAQGLPAQDGRHGQADLSPEVLMLGIEQQYCCNGCPGGALQNRRGVSKAFPHDLVVMKQPFQRSVVCRTGTEVDLGG